MGVPFFMSWLRERYPLVFKQMDDPSKPNFNCLYIDFNTLIYFALSYYDPEKEGSFEQITTEIIRYLDTIIQIVRPKDMIYISVDGTPPYAKCVRNRCKRMMGFIKNKVQDNTKIDFDIVAGSTFMEHLHNELLKFIDIKVKSDIAWSNPKVFYSSHHVPGEAEHKIFDFMRDLAEKNPDKDLVQCVFSEDSDTTFLALASRQKKLCVMRESKFAEDGTNVNEKSTNSSFELLYIPMVEEYILQDLNNGEKNDQIIFDFISLIFYLGNDFIPEFQELPSKKETFENILDCYKKTIRKNNLFLVDKNSMNFNYENLEMLFDAIMLNAAITGSVDKCAQDLLREHYPDESKSKEFVQQFIDDTFTNFEFVFQYYFGKCPSWSYFYPYEISPPFSFLRDGILKHEKKTFELGHKIDPFEAILITLPKVIKSSLPSELMALTTDENSPVIEYFPHENMERRTKEFRRIAFPYLEIFDSVYFENISKINDSEALKRNEIHNDVLITANGIEKSFEIPVLEKIEEFFPKIFGSDLVEKFDYEESIDYIKDKAQDTTHTVLAAVLKEEKRDINEFIEKNGKTVIIDWPHSKPAVVVSVCDGKFVHEKDENIKKVLKRYCDPEEEFPDEILKQSYLDRRGILLNEIKIILVVRPIKSASVTDSFYTYETAPIYVPSQIVQCEESKKFESKTIREPKVGGRIFIQNGEFQGEIAEIKEISEDEFKATLIVSRDPFVKVSGSKKSQVSEWQKMSDLCQQFSMKPKIMKKALASLPQKHIRGKGNDIEIHQKAIPNLMDIIGIKHRAPMKDSKIVKEAKYKAKTARGINYIKAVETRLEGLKIREIMADDVSVKFDDCIWRGKPLSSISANVEPGTRVVWVGDTDLVPFGSKGTVVEVHEDLLECLVISDIELPFGTTLGNRLKSRRGFTAKFGDISVIEGSV